MSQRPQRGGHKGGGGPLRPPRNPNSNPNQGQPQQSRPNLPPFQLPQSQNPPNQPPFPGQQPQNPPANRTYAGAVRGNQPQPTGQQQQQGRRPSQQVPQPSRNPQITPQPPNAAGQGIAQRPEQQQQQQGQRPTQLVSSQQPPHSQNPFPSTNTSREGMIQQSGQQDVHRTDPRAPPQSRQPAPHFTGFHPAWQDHSGMSGTSPQNLASQQRPRQHQQPPPAGVTTAQQTNPRTTIPRSNNVTLKPSTSTPNVLPEEVWRGSMDSQKPNPSDGRFRTSRPGNKVDEDSKATAQLQLLSKDKTVTLDFPPRLNSSNPSSHVLTNHFEIGLKKDMILYEYKIIPALTGRNRRKIKTIITSAIEHCIFLQNNKPNFATDYFDTIISWQNLHGQLQAPQHPCVVGDGGIGSEWTLITLRDGPSQIPLRFKFERIVDVTSLEGYTSTQPNLHNWDKEPVVKALNTLIYKCFDESLRRTIQLGANKFYVAEAHEALTNGLQPGKGRRVSNSLCTIRGYFYTIRPGIGKILLNVNTATSAFYKPMLVSDLMRDRWTWDNMDLEEVLKGLRVYITYVRGDPEDSETYARLNTEEARTKTIQNLGDLVSAQRFRPMGNNGTHLPLITVQNHLETTQQITLGSSNLHCVNLGSYDNPKWYAPEQLKILPYQMYRRTVPDRLMRGMLNTACLRPPKVRALIEAEGLEAMDIHSTHLATMLLPRCPALTIHPSLLQVPSSRMKYPSLEYRDNKYNNWVFPLQQHRWNLKDKQLLSPQMRPFNVLVIVQDGVNWDTLSRCKSAFREYLGPPAQPAQPAQPAKATCSTYSVANIVYVHEESIADLTQANMDEVMKQHKDEFDFAMLMLRRKDAGAYSAFKDLSDRQYGVQSICITESAFSSASTGDYMGNLALKANLKTAGSNHSVSGLGSHLQNTMRDTLVLGADVTHPGPGSLLACPSIAAIVGSVDGHAGRFLGSMRLQNRDKKEIIDSVESMVRERIRDWVLEQRRQGQPGTMPTNILYYRDGVGDSQYIQVRDEELPQIHAAYRTARRELQEERIVSKTMSSPTVNLTAIVVAKRHHVRFYPQSNRPADEDKHENCHPGTHVDGVVTSPYFQDFYLQSHAAIKGTARPAHYFILTDGMQRSLAFYRQLTHELCYTYVRATVGVSYASPAYYADRLCERGRHYLRDFFVKTEDGKPRRTIQAQKKRDWESNFKNQRITKFGAERDPQGRKRAKTQDELDQQVADQNSVNELLKAWSMAEVKRAFYKHGPDRNPWHHLIAKTMFWM